MKKTYKILFLTSSIFFFLSCNKVLDKEDLTSISESTVFGSESLAEANLNYFYLSIPGWDTSYKAWSDCTDEASGSTMWTNGTLTADNPYWYWPYTAIRNINTFLQKLEASTAVGDESKTRFYAEARFIRAYLYFEMWKLYGGVPVLTEPQSLSDDLEVARNSTLETFQFISDELDYAIDNLSETDNTGTSDFGRVTKAAALALQGRLYLFRASKMFNPNGTERLWQEAYDRNKTALAYLDSHGYGMVDDFSSIFLESNELNSEVVFSRRYAYGYSTHNLDACIRPLQWSQNCTGGCHPIQYAVDKFPTKSGKVLTYPDYSSVMNSYENRDDRFYATIVYNGASYFDDPMEIYSNSGKNYRYGVETYGSRTGYFSRKGIVTSQTITEAQSSGRDYLDIRYTEVMMNLAEAAIEIGTSDKLSEALGILKKVRARAGIDQTNAEMPGKEYGFSSDMTQGEMREAYRNERFVEFMYEQKRFWDMRRWKIFDQVMVGQGLRYALNLTKKDDGSYSQEFIELDVTSMINSEKMYFLPMSTSEMNNNSRLEQQKDWGGTFDPLEGM